MRQVSAGFPLFNLSKLAVSKGRAPAGEIQIVDGKAAPDAVCFGIPVSKAELREPRWIARPEGVGVKASGVMAAMLRLGNLGSAEH